MNRTSDPDTHWPCWGWELEGFQGSGGWGWPEQPGGSVPACWARCCSSPQQRLKPSQTRPPSLLQVGWAAEGIEKKVQSTTRITFFFLNERNTLQKAAKSKSFVWMRPKKVSLCKLTAFNYCSWGFFGLTAVIQDVVSTSNMRRSTMRNVNSCIWLSYSAVEKSSLISLYFLSKDPD